jgi:hypothetical protein
VRPPDGDPLLLVGAAGITASIQLGGSAELHRPEGDAGTLQVWRVGEDCVLEHELLDNLDVSIHAMYVAVLGGEPVVVAMADRSQVGDESSSDQFERVTTKFYGLFWASPGGEPVVRLEEGAGPPNMREVALAAQAGRPGLLCEFDSDDLETRYLGWFDIRDSAMTSFLDFPGQGSSISESTSALSEDRTLYARAANGRAVVYSIVDKCCRRHHGRLAVGRRRPRRPTIRGRPARGDGRPARRSSCGRSPGPTTPTWTASTSHQRSHPPGT